MLLLQLSNFEMCLIVLVSTNSSCEHVVDCCGAVRVVIVQFFFVVSFAVCVLAFLSLPVGYLWR